MAPGKAQMLPKYGYNRRRERNVPFGLERTPRVLLELLAVKFLLKHSSRPLQVLVHSERFLDRSR
jgi:hypothetical protein